MFYNNEILISFNIMGHLLILQILSWNWKRFSVCTPLVLLLHHLLESNPELILNKTYECYSNTNNNTDMQIHVNWNVKHQPELILKQ